MKDFEQFFKEIMVDSSLQEAMKEAAGSEEKLQAWLAENGVEGKAGDFARFISEKQHESKQLSDEELGDIAGGFWSFLSDVGSFFYSVGQTVMHDICS